MSLWVIFFFFLRSSSASCADNLSASSSSLASSASSCPSKWDWVLEWLLVNSSSSSSRALKCLLRISEVSEDMIQGLVRRGLGVGLGVFRCSLVLEGFWQHSVKTNNAASASFWLYRIIAAPCWTWPLWVMLCIEHLFTILGLWLLPYDAYLTFPLVTSTPANALAFYCSVPCKVVPVTLFCASTGNDETLVF